MLPPRAPTDPDVPALAHPVPPPSDSPSTMVPVAIRSSDGDMRFRPRCARHVSLDQVCWPTLRFPPRGPPGRVPQLHRYYQSATTSCCPSRRASSPSLGDTSVALALSLPDGRVRRQGLELVTRCLRPGNCRGESRISQVPGEPRFLRLPCSKPTPAGLLAPDHCGAAAWPLVIARQGLPRLGLSTLNSMAFGLAAGAERELGRLRRAGRPTPRKTRFQLLVRLSWAGFSPARFR